jgi:hydroxyethylthiazole kinase
MIEKIESALHLLRSTKPVILNITNYVTMEFVANCLLAVGAAPIMSVESGEFRELVKLCSAIYLNIGTLDDAFVARLPEIIALAQRYHKPIIFDPVGAGATALRTTVSQEFMACAAIIRGNASEVLALNGNAMQTQGVESIHTAKEAAEAAIALARSNHNTIVISGKTDFITDGTQQLELSYGSPLMSLVTGMGCALTAVIAAFHAVIDEPYEASVIGSYYFSLCGELTERIAKHPGTFRMHFIDQLHAADVEKMRSLVC